MLSARSRRWKKCKNPSSGALFLFSGFWELFLLLKIRNYQKLLSDPLGSYIEFLVMFVVTFYVFVLFPIKHFVDWFLCRCGFSADTNQDF